MIGAIAVILTESPRLCKCLTKVHGLNGELRMNRRAVNPTAKLIIDIVHYWTVIAVDYVYHPRTMTRLALARRLIEMMRQEK
jgi:hypothetical protein